MKYFYGGDVLFHPTEGYPGCSIITAMHDVESVRQYIIPMPLRSQHQRLSKRVFLFTLKQCILHSLVGVMRVTLEVANVRVNVPETTNKTPSSTDTCGIAVFTTTFTSL